jgi:quinoprotein glucose dehydrogenase
VNPGFGNEGIVDLWQGFADKWPRTDYTVTSPPVIYRDLVITGSTVPESPGKGPSGTVRSFSVQTGKKVWEFHTVPLPGEVGHDTWQGDDWKDRTGANVWSIMSVDIERGMVFLPIGSPSYDFYGADRKGKGLFGNSLVALDAATGKLIWYYQLVHHDVWDYDLPAQPTLITVHRDGREIPAVAQVTKMGFIYVFDRLTGKPLFPVEERPVPESEVPGEVTWPTQPFPLKPPPISRQSVTRAELSNVTPESHRYCTELFDSTVTHGMFTPYGLKLTLVLPGTLGGGSWSGGAFNPETSLYYVNGNEQGAVGIMIPRPAGSAERYERNSKWGGYAQFADPNGWPCVEPPWGTLNAINLETGELVWKVPLGVVDELEKKGRPPTGTSNLGGAIVTAGGLVFIAGTNDSRFRAFDARTGKQLWVTRLEASGHATPMTFLGKRNRRQYVVIAAGGGGFFPQPASDALEAYALRP